MMTRHPARRGSKSLNSVTPRKATPMSSAIITPPGSANPSPNASEIDDEIDKLQLESLTLDTPPMPMKRKSRVPATPLRFLELPSELRVKVYEHYWSDADKVLDLEPSNYKRYHKSLGLMRTCKLIHAEATHVFYSSRAIRVFPTYPGKYFKSKKPLLARMKPIQRQCLTSLELRLGPGWSAPPRGWVVNDALGLKDCTNVRKLTVYVECDPSDGFFKGFRQSEGFYEGFSCKLLVSVLNELPDNVAVEFEGYPGVKKSGAMMRGLLDVAAQANRRILWGPIRGWTDGPEKVEKRDTDHAAQLFDSISMGGYAPYPILASS